MLKLSVIDSGGFFSNTEGGNDIANAGHAKPQRARKGRKCLHYCKARRPYIVQNFMSWLVGDFFQTQNALMTLKNEVPELPLI